MEGLLMLEAQQVQLHRFLGHLHFLLLLPMVVAAVGVAVKAEIHF
jgi:hypothetical protein